MGVRETTKNAKIAKVRLGDVAWIDGCIPFPDGEKVWLLNLDMIEQQSGRLISKNIVARSEVGSSTVGFDENCVLYSKLRPNLNKVLIPTEPGVATSEILPLRYREDVLGGYLCCYLRSPAFVSYAVGRTAGAKMPRLGSKDLLAAQLPLPALPEQKRIAEELDQICELKKNADERFALMDQLVKSRFVEMFGDGCLSDEKQLFSEICEFVTVGIANSATHAYAESGVPMLRNQNIREGSLDDSDLVHIKSEFAEKYRSKTLKENDLLIVRTGYPGVSCVVPKKYEGAQTFTTLIARLRDLDETDPVFVCHYLNSPYGKEYVDKFKVGIAQQNFGARALEGMPIFIPHISLQREFAAFVAEVDKSKFVLRETVARMETLYKAKLQEYFG